MRYLQHLLDSTPKHMSFLVHSGNLEKRFMGLCSSPGSGSVMELKIHAPQFYRQMITYDKFTDFLRYTLLHPNEENHTAWSNDAERMIGCLEDLELAEKEQSHCKHPSGILQKMMWVMYDRQRPTEQLKGAYPNPGLPRARADPATSRDPPELVVRGRSFLDECVFRNCDPSLQMRYMLAVVSVQWRARIMGAIGGE